MSDKRDVIIIGGGAAGLFAALRAAEENRDLSICILERSHHLLSKVKVSGGGRCNVTHACFDPAALVKFYPRGNKELRGAFSRFQPLDTIEWFSNRGVELKTEGDGRVFPVSDSSQTIIDCFVAEAERLGIEIHNNSAVVDVSKSQEGFIVETKTETFLSKKLLMATGGSPQGFSFVKSLGHTVIFPVPSLFNFNVPSSPLKELSGAVAPSVELSVDGCSYHSRGPLLLTHFGFSGPAVLKLSAWAARDLHERGYKAKLYIAWTAERSLNEIIETFEVFKTRFPSKTVVSEVPFSLPKNLWRLLVTAVNIAPDARWGQLSKKSGLLLADKLHKDGYAIEGTTPNRLEFVTAGGVKLNEVDFKTMESRVCPGLYFAGEVLDIDGVTGGFNFQNAWTTAFLAGSAMSNQ